ncbi:response regulator [Rhizobium sp. S163]|uniref:response regulator n=1 Tax=Rhizobium sp. S163 TaxID=3055039 RepID=UPI0025A95DA9|nr:response regulator [Rhizobium sp. S163]MDM9646817.1 response regulator [Rhizobium sp. S163]
MHTSSPPVVLIIEDEPFILLDAADFISDAGFKVIEAPTADRGLQILEQGQKIDAIFTDINMPGDLDGLALASIVSARWPEIGLVITSGKVRDVAVLPAGAVFLEKPYLHERVVSAIYDTLRIS